MVFHSEESTRGESNLEQQVAENFVGESQSADKTWRVNYCYCSGEKVDQFKLVVAADTC